MFIDLLHSKKDAEKARCSIRRKLCFSSTIYPFHEPTRATSSSSAPDNAPRCFRRGPLILSGASLHDRCYGPQIFSARLVTTVTGFMPCNLQTFLTLNQGVSARYTLHGSPSFHATWQGCLLIPGGCSVSLFPHEIPSRHDDRQQDPTARDIRVLSDGDQRAHDDSPLDGGVPSSSLSSTTTSSIKSVDDERALLSQLLKGWKSLIVHHVSHPRLLIFGPLEIEKIPASFNPAAFFAAVDLNLTNLFAVDEIGSNVFSGCAAKSLTLPINVRVIGDCFLGGRRGSAVDAVRFGCPHDKECSSLCCDTSSSNLLKQKSRPTAAEGPSVQHALLPNEQTSPNGAVCCAVVSSPHVLHALTCIGKNFANLLRSPKSIIGFGACEHLVQLGDDFLTGAELNGIHCLPPNLSSVGRRFLSKVKIHGTIFCLPAGIQNVICVGEDFLAELWAPQCIIDLRPCGKLRVALMEANRGALVVPGGFAVNMTVKDYYPL